MPTLDVLNKGAAAKLDVALKGLFPTPVATVTVPDAFAINNQLRQIILDRERASEGTRHSNEGGWQSDHDMMSWGGPAFLTVVNMGIAIANNLTCDRKGNPVEVDWKINSWANINRTGNANIFHTHPGAYWSASYYVDDGGAGKDPSLGGEFEIMDPRGVAPAMYAPLLAHKSPGGLSVGAAEVVTPVAGMLMMFPSWLCHGVRIYRGNDMRISVAFNLSL